MIDGLVLTARAVGPAGLPHHRPSRSSGTSASRSPSRRAAAHRVVQVDDRFVSGEESALVNAVNGRPGVPSDRSGGSRARRAPPPDPGAQRRDPRARRAARPVRPGLVPVGRHRRRARHLPVHGQWRGAVARRVRGPLRYVAGRLLAAAGGSPRDAQAVLVGGYHGAWVPGHAVGEHPDVEGPAGHPRGLGRRRRGGRPRAGPLRPRRERRRRDVPLPARSPDSVAPA